MLNYFNLSPFTFLLFHGCRYKIYVEGNAWSVSEKYILACDSVTLVIMPRYYDFFTRNLVPTVHYWPINEDQKCRSIKFAVDWGNKHTTKVTISFVIFIWGNRICGLSQSSLTINPLIY